MGVNDLVESYIFPFMFVETYIQACPYPRNFKVNERNELFIFFYKISFTSFQK